MNRNADRKVIGLGSKQIRLGCCIVFYLAFCLIFGVQMGADSAGYIRMIAAREPVYPLFLWLMRSIFGEVHYLWVVILLQNLLMAAAVWWSTEELGRRFGLPDYVMAVMIAVHFGVACICQFLAERGAIYSNMIMTEGITISLWIIFMTLLLRAVLDADLKALAAGLLLAAVMTDTRKQMAVAYITLPAAMFFGRMGKDGLRDHLKRLLVTLGGIVLSLLLAVGGTRLYNYVLRGDFAQNTRDMNLVLTTTLYAADPEDAALIEEEGVRELFTMTMDILAKSGSNYRYAGDGWRALEAHYEEHFDIITIDTTGDMYIEYAEKQGFAAGIAAEQEADRMSAVIVKSLFMDNLKTYLRIYGASVLNGLINTVAKRGSLLDWYALAVYPSYIVLMLLCLRKKESREAGLAGAFVLLAVLINVGVAAALIFCQTRYMIYNMALFYVAGILMLWKYVCGRQRPDIQTGNGTTEGEQTMQRRSIG
ncbi:MAG: hypothetical protein IJ600_01450 [Lachnospiraceae bacterium]|nr:hypothetical protein [Lachnospiraceae bacterium]